MRFRRSHGTERQQIKWVAFGLLAGFVAACSAIPSTTPSERVVGGAGFLAFPASIGVAILRFHLYDLDVVVRKTVLYAALAVFATVVYLAIVVGVGVAGPRELVPHDGVAAVVVAGDVPARPDPPDTARRPCRVREAGNTVRGALRVLRTRRGRVLGRGRAAAHGSRARRGVGPSERTCGSPFRTSFEMSRRPSGRHPGTGPTGGRVRARDRRDRRRIPGGARGSCSACWR